MKKERHDNICLNNTSLFSGLLPTIGNGRPRFCASRQQSPRCTEDFEETNAVCEIQLTLRPRKK